ncbi:MAG TPA: GDSL-type esterase/lipase family protein [Rugosimonospora sp.]|nr:GDSL-type esterase/lipase family protein [Rugosimonospora sp.]
MTVSVTVACGLVLGARPALAAPPPAPAGAAHGKTAAAETTATGSWAPHPKRPGPVLVPRKGTQAAPFTAPLTPVAPRALPGSEKATASTLDPNSVAKGRSAIRRVAPADVRKVKPADEGGGPYNCQEFISGSTGVGSDDSIGPYSNTQYLAELGCNFYLDYAYGVSGVVDRSPGYDGTLLYVGTPFEFSGYYYGASPGAFQIPGDLYDGGRQMEIVFELYLLAPQGLIWGACGPLPGLRYLACDGLGTDLLHIVVGTGVLGTGLAPPVIRYVALGDSYSAGTGTGTFYNDGTTCRRSPLVYSNLLAGRDFGGLPIDVPTLKACNGGRIGDLYTSQAAAGADGPQILWVNHNRTRLVTMTMGGNDLGFASTLTRCALPTDCTTDGPLISPDLLQSTQSRLTLAYRDIRARMRSDGYLVVIGYPAFLPIPGQDPTSGNCPLVSRGFSINELNAIKDTAVQVDNMIASAVAAVGDPHVLFVNAFAAFSGHRVCSSDEWSNGIRLDDTEESFHPNSRGYQAIEAQIALALGITG